MSRACVFVDGGRNLSLADFDGKLRVICLDRLLAGGEVLVKRRRVVLHRTKF